MLSVDDVMELIQNEIRPLRTKVENMVVFGKMLSMNDDKTPAVQAEAANNEVINGARYIQPWGHYSKPRQGSELLLAKIQGNPNNVVVLVIGNREVRFTELSDGEVAIADDSGCYIHLKNGGNMEVVAPETLSATAKVVNINAETLNATAQTANINGDKVNLAGGGAGVALLGCTVEVDPNSHKGTITSASTKVSAG